MAISCTKCDAEMLRVKACEHIAEGEEGWQKLRNECPSTMAVAVLRDRFESCAKLKKACEERVYLATAELLDMIDGGDECRARDGSISHIIGILDGDPNDLVLARKFVRQRRRPMRRTQRSPY